MVVLVITFLTKALFAELHKQGYAEYAHLKIYRPAIFMLLVKERNPFRFGSSDLIRTMSR